LPGGCVYLAEWFNEDPLATAGPRLLSAQCFFMEQRTQGNVACRKIAVRPALTIVRAITTDPDPCKGFTPFGQISTIVTLQLGETQPERRLEGIVQFDGVLVDHNVYGIVLRR
jgi:hypothetical protein